MVHLEEEVCEFCGQDMTAADGCVRVPITHKGKSYEPIKVGGKGDTFENAAPSMRCTDCGAKYGFYHHPGCEYEICPVCGDSAKLCCCEFDDISGVFGNSN